MVTPWRWIHDKLHWIRLVDAADNVIISVDSRAGESKGPPRELLDVISDAPAMLGLLREVADCEAHDVMPVLPFELQDRVRDLLKKHGRSP